MAKQVIIAMVVTAGAEVDDNGGGAGDGDEDSVPDGTKWSWFSKIMLNLLTSEKNTY